MHNRHRRLLEQKMGQEQVFASSGIDQGRSKQAALPVDISTLVEMRLHKGGGTDTCCRREKVFRCLISLALSFSLPVVCVAP